MEVVFKLLFFGGSVVFGEVVGVVEEVVGDVVAGVESVSAVDFGVDDVCDLGVEFVAVEVGVEFLQAGVDG